MTNTMTTRLKAVIKRIEALPKEEQDVLATVIEEELAGERAWEDLFATTSEEAWSSFSAAVDAHREEGVVSLDDLRRSA